MNQTCSCIIPCYNEQKNIEYILGVLLNTKMFNEVIIVNDGSNDNTLEKVKKYKEENKIKNLKIISYEENKGKTEAIKQGLAAVYNRYTFLFDADLHNLKIQEIEDVIQTIYNDKNIDMGVLRPSRVKRYIKLFYKELLLSGQRILRTQDLKDFFVENKDVYGYQLEVAINLHMKNKKTVWFPFSGSNVLKYEKRGIWRGIYFELSMRKDILFYIGLRGVLDHIRYFKPVSIKKYQKKQEFIFSNL